MDNAFPFASIDAPILPLEFLELIAHLTPVSTPPYLPLHAHRFILMLTASAYWSSLATSFICSLYACSIPSQLQPLHIHRSLPCSTTLCINTGLCPSATLCMNTDRCSVAGLHMLDFLKLCCSSLSHLNDLCTSTGRTSIGYMPAHPLSVSIPLHV